MTSPSTKFTFMAPATRLTSVEPCSPGRAVGEQQHRCQRPRTPPPPGYEYCPPWPPTPEWMAKPSKKSGHLSTNDQQVEELATLPTPASIPAKKKKVARSKGNNWTRKKRKRKARRAPEEQQENNPSEPPRKRQKIRK
ncbi:unnamed protein product [Cyclocybe aegerita]|uniref:Uncharacterized protein n=1 Tax=Cyclocybe aegerita TaxID=1973307 RepID=A0A8S0X1D9_CYCAE|nr:unnamed protein product [Cyclocybe aegerita]